MSSLFSLGAFAAQDQMLGRPFEKSCHEIVRRQEEEGSRRIEYRSSVGQASEVVEELNLCKTVPQDRC